MDEPLTTFVKGVFSVPVGLIPKAGGDATETRGHFERGQLDLEGERVSQRVSSFQVTCIASEVSGFGEGDYLRVDGWTHQIRDKKTDGEQTTFSLTRVGQITDYEGEPLVDYEGKPIY